ncbi:MAG: hypothetical protein OEY70_13895 [Acidimicrobiia bacterium]|nr:hypothetical protein [Acidimicrobiia bacterium]
MDDAVLLDGLILFCLDDGQDLGELEEVVAVGRHRYVVVDARHWSYGARKLVPVDAVDVVDDGVERHAVTPADRDWLRCSPDFDPFQLANPGYVKRVDRYFARG